MAGSFTTRIRELEARGDLVGSVVVDQIYAKYQHETLHFKHTAGGQAKYLEAPLYSNMAQYAQKVADTALEDGGVRGMTEVVEDLSEQVRQLAPIDINNLRRSAHPMVVSNGKVVYDRAPEQRRLTEEEIEEMKPLSRHQRWFDRRW